MNDQALTPKKIVEALDKHIVGQADAKRAVAVALRNRWRRKHVSAELRDEIGPKNILMIGPTGVGKTEIARRLAKLADAPLVKVEASKFTEVGYVGRDVESIIRDLLSAATDIVRAEKQKQHEEPARREAIEELIDKLIPELETKGQLGLSDYRSPQAREIIARKIDEGKLDDMQVEIELEMQNGPAMAIPLGQPGMEEVERGLKDMFGSLMPKRRKRTKLSVAAALRQLTDAKLAEVVDEDAITAEAIDRVEQDGIVFLDEIDKVCASSGVVHGGDVSREGVQRDLLPIIEGSVVPTRSGNIRTDHILFIAAGAFHVSKPSDLIPELQGRLPIRVELQSLGKEDFVRILTEPNASLIRQYTELLRTEGVEVSFESSAIERLAEIAAEVNASTENIGARRLHTVMERLLEEISYTAPDLAGQTVPITREYVDTRLKDIADKQDLSRYIL